MRFPPLDERADLVSGSHARVLIEMLRTDVSTPEVGGSGKFAYECRQTRLPKAESRESA